jgi:hypothetical protein
LVRTPIFPQGTQKRSRAVTTPTSRSVSMHLPNFNLQPVIDAWGGSGARARRAG